MRSVTSAATPAAAADDANEAAASPFVEWASAHRLRAARDGAWKVEVSERVVNGNITRFVTSWHGSAKQPDVPLRRTRQQCSNVSAKSQQQSTRSATDEQLPPRQAARQRRSALRSAAHHRYLRLRALRRLGHVVRFIARLSRLTVASRALRAVQSPAKRRLSPPREQEHHLLRPASKCSSDDDDAALQPPPKRPETGRLAWMREVVSRAFTREQGDEYTFM